MAGNTFGTLFRVTTFGESHGPAMGLVIDGCPAGLKLDLGFISSELARRKPGQSKIVSQRKENEDFQILSGLFEGKTTGAPLAFIVPNEDARSKDYDSLKTIFRPSHADFTYEEKYGIRDHRGGGRSSARETVARVIAGAVAKMILKKNKTSITAFVSQVGNIVVTQPFSELDFDAIEKNEVRCPDPGLAKKMIAKINEARKKGDTLGGVITCVAQGVPVGLGEPVFDKLQADLAKAVMSIPAAKGFEIGSGFSAAGMSGSEHNDIFSLNPNPSSKGAGSTKVRTLTNYSGGIQGGISNGEVIYFRVAFKPVSTILSKQKSITKELKEIEFAATGRHDPCVVPRAVPIVEAMTAIVLADHFLRNKAVQL